jgi:glycine cleavage system H protein
MSGLVFMMGEFAAEFPTDRQYARNHMWAKRQGDVFRFGFTAYAVRLLQDVYFLDWTVPTVNDGADPVEDGSDRVQLVERQEIGAIESKKAESDLFAPMAGNLLRFNEALFSDPSWINVDKYERGWLFEMAGSGVGLMSAQEYVEHLGAVWEVTQRTIKGQLN